jgi:hypothetical protein
LDCALRLDSTANPAYFILARGLGIVLTIFSLLRGLPLDCKRCCGPTLH